MVDHKEPLHPGEILADELEAIGINAVELAKRIGVPNNRLYAIIEGKRSITADTALRLGRFFTTGPDFWMNLQKDYELDKARQEIDDQLRTIEPYQRHQSPENTQVNIF